MPLLCFVPGCKNSSCNPECFELQWHRLPREQDSLKRLINSLGLPSDTVHSTAKRVCSSCMSKVPKGRKPPKTREIVSHTTSGHHRYTRSELRQAVALDHCYSRPAEQDPSMKSSCLSRTTPADIIQPLPLDRPLPETFCVEMYAVCFNFLGDAVNHLIYPGSKFDPSRIPRSKTQRAITPINEFFMTLCRLRCGLLEFDLAFRFKISQSTVSRILTTWINFLYCKFQEIPIWPTREQVQSQMPTQFKMLYPNTRVIIDATEIFIQRPTNPNAQQITFSSYKNHNTAKALAGITPSGAFSFIAPLYGGSISDRELFVSSGILEKLDAGDAVMADKGFNIADILESRGISLNIPPRKNDDQLSSRELIETRRIASLRIHIERAFQRVKLFRVLNHIPNNMAGLSSEIFYTCAIITNFQQPLVMDQV